jgi:dolichol-phosphate mannosyltransferase
LIKQIAPLLKPSDLILILDDSDNDEFQRTILVVESEFTYSLGKLLFNNVEVKSGRGTAIRRGMSFSYKNFPNMMYFIECDGDGSHQPTDILSIKDYGLNCDLLIGSRYLPKSKILGWPITRRIFSYLLNKIIPFVFNLPITDVTNGLRRYSKKAVNAILHENPENSGFIYLTEQALIVKKNGLEFKELPINFVNRIIGNSSVSLRDVLLALKGLLQLLLHKI